MTFENLPDESRIWIYGFDRPLEPDQYNIVKERLERFKNEWMYHGNSVTGDYEIFENQFVIIATNEAISGCSIDSSVAVFKDFKNEHHLDALNQNLVYFRDHGKIITVSRVQFQELVNNGQVTENTIVFNLMISHLGSLKKGNFETTFQNSWHCKVFKIAEEVN
jgi:hypothetical protein